MREIMTEKDYVEMLAQNRVVLSFYHNWSRYSAVYGIKYFKQADIFFQNQADAAQINFWLADVSNTEASANFLCDWIKNNSTKFNLFRWIAAGNPSAIWLNSGQILHCEFSTYILKFNGIVRKTNEYFTKRIEPKDG